MSLGIQKTVDKKLEQVEKILQDFEPIDTFAKRVGISKQMAYFAHRNGKLASISLAIEGRHRPMILVHKESEYTRKRGTRGGNGSGEVSAYRWAREKGTSYANVRYWYATGKITGYMNKAGVLVITSSELPESRRNK